MNREHRHTLPIKIAGRPVQRLADDSADLVAVIAPVAELALELPSAQVRAVDLMGRELTPSADSAQRSRLTVGCDPIYVGFKGDRPR